MRAKECSPDRSFQKVVIRQVLEAHLPGAKLEPDRMYALPPATLQALSAALQADQRFAGQRIVWTRSFQRMYVLVKQCLRHKEPVLLIGPTGCGKTSVCQILAALTELELRVLNLHEHTETADFLGGLRPLRNRAQRASNLCRALGALFEAAKIPAAASVLQSAQDASTLFHKSQKALKKAAAQSADVAHLLQLARVAAQEYETLFQWYDGPLVDAMKRGQILLLDEISLAEDAVLERLNSVLEQGRSLLLAEKGGVRAEELRAHSDFRILATMNPGGDFGKRELSPALRNRFTEIWIPPVESLEDLGTILQEQLTPLVSSRMLQFSTELSGSVKLGLRDFLAWADFIKRSPLALPHAFVHGACLVALDGLAVSSTLSASAAAKIRASLLNMIGSQLFPDEGLRFVHGELVTPPPAAAAAEHQQQQQRFSLGSFSIPLGSERVSSAAAYALDAPTTAMNLTRLLRGLQVHKPILLEGSPGQGKTSLVLALARISGHRVVRINLSEETDMMDLLGADLPVEGGTGGEFRWQDGVFLQALKRGDWVLLDELNLASQSILEGLNSVLDHRAEIFVPELNQSFACPPSFRVFACQNPTSQGGGRKGLPKSFLNRFTKVRLPLPCFVCSVASILDSPFGTDWILFAQGFSPWPLLR